MSDKCKCDRGWNFEYHNHNGDEDWVPCPICNKDGRTYYGLGHPLERPKIAAAEITRLRAELEHQKIITEQVQLDYLGAVDERDTLRQQLAEAQTSTKMLSLMVHERDAQLAAAHQARRSSIWPDTNYILIHTEAERDTLRQQLAVAREGLGFYANPENWKPLITRRRGQDQLSVEVDDGAFARDTLAKLDQSRSEIGPMEEKP